jgi:hypothetical protein
MFDSKKEALMKIMKLMDEYSLKGLPGDDESGESKEHEMAESPELEMEEDKEAAEHPEMSDDVIEAISKDHLKEDEEEPKDGKMNLKMMVLKGMKK